MAYYVDNLSRKKLGLKKLTYKDLPLPKEKYHFEGLLVETGELGEVILDSHQKIDEIVPIVKTDAAGNKSYWIPRLIEYSSTLTNKQLKEAAFSKKYHLFEYFYFQSLEKLYWKIQNGNF